MIFCVKIYLLYNVLTNALGNEAQARLLLAPLTAHAAKELKKAGIELVQVVHFAPRGKTYQFYNRDSARADGAALQMGNGGVSAVFANGKEVLLPVPSVAQVVPIYIADYNDTGNPAQGTHGYADIFNPTALQNGIFLSSRVVPGDANADPNYAEGDVLVHELGHFLGDLPHEKSQYSACQADGKAARNIMDYAPDQCRHGYTEAQAQQIAETMQARVSQPSAKVLAYSPIKQFLTTPPTWFAVMLIAASLAAFVGAIYFFTKNG